MSMGKILDLELDRRDGGVLDIVTLLGALRLETRLWGPLLHSSSAHFSTRWIFRGVHGITVESKTMSSSGPIESRHLLAIS
jgi:hypothetical protein